MSKHTPGPWLHRGKNDAVYTPPPDGAAYQYGTLIFRFDDEDGPNDADLDLILAAPDLLRIATVLLYEYECAGYCPSKDFIKECKEVIAKATGERGEEI